MPKAMIDSLLAISESVAATRYPDRVKQRAFLDEKTVALEGFSTMIPAIARDKSLYDQAHRTELEDARVAAEEQAAAEAAATAKPKKSKGKKAKKSKAIVEDIDDDVSVFDDSEFPMTEALAQCILAIDELRASFSNMQVEEGIPSTSHRTTQSLDAHASAFPVTPTPSTRPSSHPDQSPQTSQSLRQESVIVHSPMPTRTPRINMPPQSLLTNGPAVQKTIAEVHQILSTDQSDTDSIGD
ncbi:hypothetical protein B0H14DRAFT_3536518 [Mycena olivaceomarginata]|nr:hypothetical protein B0H14DRAFT_3536518 [Mycena olivaceomarginata]